MILALLIAKLSGYWLGLSVVGFCIVCILLVLTILIQRPQGGGSWKGARAVE